MCFPIHVSMTLVFVKMDVKLPLSIIFLICVTYGLHNASAQSTFSEATLSTVSSDGKCTRKYTACTLDLGGKIIKERGEKGDPGSPGLKGEPGVEGAKGETGVNGTNGLQGLKGDPGEDGKEGPQGPPGVPGKNGRNGNDGMPGLPGAKGERGENGKIGPAGPMGSPGPEGRPGIPGSHGVCPCSMPPNIMDAPESDKDHFGIQDSPADVPCKAATTDIPSGLYYMGPPAKDMIVYCNMTTLETCIRFNNRTPECNHKSSKGGSFWLNEMNIRMKELYKSISVDQLTWLRDRSDYVRQTLKYHCLDSVPYNKHNMSASVKLWAWNDVMIGPYPTNESPIFYSVPKASDHCEAGSTEWKSTIIELQSSNVYRLPIVDLWIGDIRDVEHQKMSIESIEVCFG